MKKGILHINLVDKDNTPFIWLNCLVWTSVNYNIISYINNQNNMQHNNI